MWCVVACTHVYTGTHIDRFLHVAMAMNTKWRVFILSQSNVAVELILEKAITKYSSYIENLSLVFMEIGWSSPRHQELALLYAQSKSLQAYVSECFIVTSIPEARETARTGK
jgi:hypothetical protein